MSENSTPSPLELTHVLYDANSYVSLAMALVTLSPILLMASYAALAVMTRELLVINMWAGQVMCEGFNWLLKRAIKQERPPSGYGRGYGFPSSHSQYMGYFASFLICHLFLRHRFPSCGYAIVDRFWRLTVYASLLSWAAIVCYSRYELTYHTPTQIAWGASIGACFGAVTYFIAELIPARRPQSTLGIWRTAMLSSQIFSWLRIRDGWAIWEDGGREAEWHNWKSQWEAKRSARSKAT